jgi:trigger factor
MSIEVGPEVVVAETAKVVRRYAEKARIPGFRPGKAPLSLVQTRFREEVAEEVKDQLISRLYADAAKEKGVKALGDPVLDEVVFEEGKPFSFKTTFEIWPEIDPKGYEGVEVTRPTAAVSDEDVTKSLEEIRESQAKLVLKDKEAVTGDFLLANILGTPEKGDVFDRENVLVEIGSNHNLPEFNDRIEGAKKGDVLEFSVTYPKEHPNADMAGMEVAYKLTIHEVKVREMPELDDEFAKDLGEFDTLAQLSERIRTDLTTRKEQDAENQVKKELMDKILLENPATLPDVLVEEEIRHRMEDMVRSMMMQGVDPKELDVNWKEVRGKQEEPARTAVHARLVLDAIAEKTDLQVESSEVDDKIRAESERIGETYEELRKRLTGSGGLQSIRVQLLREKALDSVLAAAEIREEE